MHTRSEVKAGAVIVVSVALFALVIVSVGRFGEFFEKKQILHVFFSDVQGLKIDDPVQVMGFEKGKVVAIHLAEFTDEEGLKIPAIEITAKVASPEPFSVDSKFTIDRTLTGNTVLKIEPGRSPDKFTSNQKIRGLGAISVTEMANKLGIMAKRVDDFLTDLTDRNMVGSIRSAMLNMKQITDNAKVVMGSLSQSVPGTEKNIINAVKNLNEITSVIDQIVVSNRTKLSGAIENINALTESIAKVSKSLDQIIERNHDAFQGTLSNFHKSSSNLKALTREVRWQPWVLLNKPDEVEVRERSVYNSALEFSEGAESLNTSIKDLSLLVNKNESSKKGLEEYKALLDEIHSNLQKSAELERKLWSTLNEKAKVK